MFVKGRLAIIAGRPFVYPFARTHTRKRRGPLATYELRVPSLLFLLPPARPRQQV